MPTYQENHADYYRISEEKGLIKHCPFASVDRCPRYYCSISLLGNAGITTSIDEEEDRILEEKWMKTDLWPRIAEEGPDVSGPTGNLMLAKFCPEVAYLAYKLFSADLAGYRDEIDQITAHKKLEKTGATGDDYRWKWLPISFMHYTDCPTYPSLEILAKILRAQNKAINVDLILKIDTASTEAIRREPSTEPTKDDKDSEPINLMREEGEFRHSPDYRCLEIADKKYKPTSLQAEVIQFLDNEATQETPIHHDRIMVEIDRPTSKMKNIFRSQPNIWKDVIGRDGRVILLQYSGHL